LLVEECLLVDRARISIPEIEREGHLTLNCVLSYQLHLVSAFCVGHFYGNSGSYFYSVGVDEGDRSNVMVVPVVEEKGGGGGSC